MIHASGIFLKDFSKLVTRYPWCPTPFFLSKEKLIILNRIKKFKLKKYMDS